MSDDQEPTSGEEPAPSEPNRGSGPDSEPTSEPDRGDDGAQRAGDRTDGARPDAEGAAGAGDTVGTDTAPPGDGTATEPTAEARSSRSSTTSLWLVVFSVALLLGAGAVLWRASQDPKGTDTDQASTVEPGESEAVDFADRKPANPSGDAASANSVRLGVGDWTEAGFVGAIVSQVIEELGYPVRSAAPMGPDEAYNALAEGQLDIWTDAWFPAHEPYLAVETGDGSAVGDQLETISTTTPAGGVMGIFVTTEWADDNSVSTIEDVLAQPDAASLFDLTGDDIPDFYGCNPTWPCAETINAVIRERGWRVSQYAGDYDASVQSAIARTDSGEPALVFTWLPSTYGADLGVADGRFSLLGVADPGDGDVVTATPCRADPCVTGFAVDDLGMATTKSFVAEHPDIAAVLGAVQVPQGDISAALEAVAQGDTLEAQADAWIETHRSEVDAWLAAGA